MASILNATTSSGLVTSADNSGSLQLATNNGTTAVTIDTSQKVLIGTTASPSAAGALLTVSGASAAYTQYNKGTSGGGVVGSEGTGVVFYTYTGNIGSEAYTERMRINSSGQLLISTSTVYNTATTNVGFVGNVGSGISVNTTTATNGATFQVFLSTGTLIGSISNNNNTGVSYNTTSDYRLKENIAPMTGALAVVQQLKPVTYTWKSTGEASQGFIAHELQEIVPDCVTGEKDAVETYTDENGNEQTRIKPQGIDTSFLVATLTAAIQELKAELDATKAEVQALKGVA